MEDIMIKTDTMSRAAPVMAGRGLTLQNPAVDDQTAKNGQEEAAKSKKTANVNTKELAEKANKHVESFSTKIAFSYDSERHQSMIMVTDKDTGKVIRQIPAEEMLELMEKMDEIAGIIFNGRA